MITRHLRRPAASGTFYPADPAGLIATVDGLLVGAAPGVDGGPALRGVIVPHAGYRYAGPVAASAYVRLAPPEGGPARVAVLGPAHFVPLLGVAVPAADAWLTPIGDVAIDPELRDAAVAAGAAVSDHPHAREHALEVQLPFLQRRLGDLRVLPVAVGASAPEAVADVIEALAPRATIVVSTDLSHYHDRETARRLDRRTADAIVSADAEAVGPDDACGVHALRGALVWAARRSLRIRLLDLRTSADTAGDPGRVVGYGAFTISAAG